MKKESFIKKAGSVLSISNTAILLGVGMSGFHLYTGIFGSVEAMKQGSIHLVFALVLVLLIIPAKKGSEKKRLAWYDWAFILASLASL